MIGRALLYSRTVRHLRWMQIVRRVTLLSGSWTPGRFAAPFGVSDRALQLLGDAVYGWGPDDPAGRLQAADRVSWGEFRFLNESRQLGDVNWRAQQVSRLWTYNLHYFDYALDLAWAYRITSDSKYLTKFENLAQSWIDGGRGGPGWEPYPLSVRMLNWLYSLALLGPAVSSGARARILASCAEQAAVLDGSIEWHLLGNHVQKNLCALVVSAFIFTGRVADRRRRRAWHLLRREISQQVLDDGGHYERSPMYHLLFLTDLLELADFMNRCGQRIPAAVLDRLGRMSATAGLLCRADGSVHLLQDSARGVTRSSRHIEALGVALHGVSWSRPEGKWSLPATQYTGFSVPAAGERLIVDAGGPSPPFQPGHAHSGILSFELDLAGRAVFVGPGVSGYDGDALRPYVRSTRAHNTVTIGGKDQAELWGTFRVARRPRLRKAPQVDTAAAFDFTGAYSPFHSHRTTHQRRIQRDEHGWLITDAVMGADRLGVESFLHFHPDFEVRLEGAAVVGRAAELEVRVEPFGMSHLRVEVGELDPVQGWHCPEFGVRIPAAAVCMTVSQGEKGHFGYRIRSRMLAKASDVQTFAAGAQ